MALAQRRLRHLTVRESLIEWARYRGFEPAEHHRLIIREIAEFLVSDDDVLLLFAPPGSGKSVYLSVLFPSHYLAQNPTHAILAATHSGDFAMRWGRRVRNDILAEGDALGIQLASDSQAADRWALTTGGEYYGVGAGVGIAGFRADLGVVDDLFGTREDAFSERIRQNRWDWYLYDFSARLKPRAKRILMNTRWHESDVAGRVLDQIDRGHIRGRIISIPAEAESEDDILGRKPGEFLWDDPEGYNYGAFLRARKRETSPMMWSALYQQRPAPETGDFWKADWLHPYTTEPDRTTLSVYGGSDYAVTKGGGDYTVHVVIGIDPEDRPWLLDLWRGQASPDVWIDRWCDLVRKWKPYGWAEEKGQIASGIGPFRDKRAHERQAYVALEDFPTRGDKSTRAQSMRGRVAQLGLHVPTDAPWYAEFRAELMSFPAGAHDDQVDALGLVGQLLDKMTAGRKPKEAEVAKRSGYAPVRSESADSFKVM